MRRRLKKLFLAMVGLGLIAGNTDWAIGALLARIPGRYSITQLFIMFALIANLQAVLWYKLGRILVEVLADCYCSIRRWQQHPKTPKASLWFLRRGLSVLHPFYDWSNTKIKLRSMMEDMRRSPKYMILTLGSWLLFPGSRSLTAILFGMEEWRGAMVLLLAVNTIHVALSFGFWAALFELARMIWALF